MQRNQKLTKAIAGRTIKTVTTEPGSVLVLFDDQSSLKIKTTGAAAVSPGSKVKSAHEAKVRLNSKSILKTVRARYAPHPIRARPLRYETRTMLSNISHKSS